MSLPTGIVNRPAMVAPPPQVVGRVVRGAARILVLLLPLLLHVAAQVPGLAWRRQCAEFEQAIAQQQVDRRTLVAVREALLAPERLRREAERLALVPPGPAERPTVLQPVRVAEARR